MLEILRPSSPRLMNEKNMSHRKSYSIRVNELFYYKDYIIRGPKPRERVTRHKKVLVEKVLGEQMTIFIIP